MAMKFKPVKIKYKYDENGRSENDFYKKVSWFILIRSSENTHCYVEFTEKNFKGKKTTLRILKMIKMQMQLD